MHVVFTLVSFPQVPGYSYGFNLLCASSSYSVLWGQLECLNREINKVEFPHGEKTAITRPPGCFQSAMRTAHSVENACYRTGATKGIHCSRINCYRKIFITLINEHFYDGLFL